MTNKRFQFKLHPNWDLKEKPEDTILNTMRMISLKAKELLQGKEEE